MSIATEKNVSVIESKSYNGAYDFRVNMVILDHAILGRILITQAFGGQSELRGGAVRWEHGAVYQLLAGDTFESLESEKHNDYTTVMDATLQGYRDDRPVLPFGPSAKAYAKSAGLI